MFNSLRTKANLFLLLHCLCTQPQLERLYYQHHWDQNNILISKLSLFQGENICIKLGKVFKLIRCPQENNVSGLSFKRGSTVTVTSFLGLPTIQYFIAYSIQPTASNQRRRKKCFLLHMTWVTSSSFLMLSHHSSFYVNCKRSNLNGGQTLGTRLAW